MIDDHKTHRLSICWKMSATRSSTPLPLAGEGILREFLQAMDMKCTIRATLGSFLE